MTFPIGVTTIKEEDLPGAMQAVEEMQKLGHSVELHVDTDSGYKFLSATFTHYRTCRGCRRNPKEEVSRDGKVEQAEGNSGAVQAAGDLAG